MGETFLPEPGNITIVMATRGRRELVAARLRENHHRPLLLVIDQGRRELDLPADLPADVEVLETPDIGAPRKFEAGILHARTPFVIITNDDSTLAPDFVAEAIKVYRAQISPRAGVVATNDHTERGLQASFPLMARSFYIDHCCGTPYERYFIDTEWSYKARWLGVYAYAPKAEVTHYWHDGQDRLALERDREIFNERMDLFRRSRTRHAPRVMIALPIDNGAKTEFWQCVTSLVFNHAVDYQFEFNVGDALVARARNELTARFLNSDCTHLLFIDSDIIFDPQDIVQLLKRQLDIVGGLYAKKQAECEYVCNQLDGATTDATGLRPLRYIGTGFVLIKRGVFTTMIDKIGDAIAYRADGHGRREHDFWSVGVYQYPDGNRRYLSEDWFFCQRALDLGFQVWADTRIVLRHVGQAIYPLQAPSAGMFSPPQAGNGTPGADAIRPSSAPANSN